MLATTRFLTTLVISLVMVIAGACKQEGQAKKETGGKGGTTDSADVSKSPSPTPDGDGDKDDGDADEGEESTTIEAKMWLKIADLKAPSDLQTFTSTTIKDEINGDSDYFNDAPDSDNDDDCISKEMAKHKLKVTGDRVSLAFDADIADCSKDYFEEDDGVTMTVTEARVKVAAWIECPGVDAAKYDGKPGDAMLNDDSPCDTAKDDTKVAMNMRYVLKGKMKSDGTTNDIDLDLKFAQVNESNGGCVWNYENSAFTTDGCVAITVVANKSEGSDGSTFNRHEYQDLVRKAQEKYYRSGKMGIEFNGWKGAMSYTSATAAPTFTLTKGTETATGTFTYDAGTNLTAPKRRPGDALEGAIRTAAALQ